MNNNDSIQIIDHRDVGKAMDLFHIQEEAVGQIFWHEKGWRLYRLIQDYMRNKLEKYNYKEVNTPQIVSISFWEKSGHWDKYRKNMFTVKADEEDLEYALKPMNCPCHIQIFKNKIRSYKDLPIRLAEFGSCCRYEPSGSLCGLFRVRGFTQDDAHIFCEEDQIESEALDFYNLLREVYSDFGFHNIKVRFSDRPEQRVGSDELWNKAEKALLSVLEKLNIDYQLNKGDGAFYGPKLEFVLMDSLDREWQCGTLQVDFNLASRLGAQYVDVNGEYKNPVMLHRAILGSFERFIAILLEHYKGKLPFWLQPIQLRLLGVNNNMNDYLILLQNKFKSKGVRCECDLSNEKLQYKIKKCHNELVPCYVVIGNKEKEANTIKVEGFDEDCIKSLKKLNGSIDSVEIL